MTDPVQIAELAMPQAVAASCAAVSVCVAQAAVDHPGARIVTGADTRPW